MPLKQDLRTWPDLLVRIMFCALLYRIPKAVTEVRVYARGDSYPVCPSCRRSLDREYVDFCDRCGQRLDWGEFENVDESDLLWII